LALGENTIPLSAALTADILPEKLTSGPLPPPPAVVSVPSALPSCETLHDAAQSRPDLYAQAARIRAEEAALGPQYARAFSGIPRFLPEISHE